MPLPLTIAEAAALLGCSPSTVRRYDARLQPDRIGGRRVYHHDAVAELIAQRAAQTAARGRRKMR